MSTMPISEQQELAQKVDVTLIPGFYKDKYKFKVVNVVDFVNKVKKVGFCDKFFSYND